MDMLTITDLHKSFGEKSVLRGVNLTVPEGSIFGFVGRNGSGKTTTMKAILGLLRADAGSITVGGECVTCGQTATNRFIGYLPDVPSFYPYMTAPEYLRFCGDLLGLPHAERERRVAEMLSLVGLTGEAHRIKGFSRGMKQRLGIAQALLGTPKLLICDEPTSALDPVGRKEILDILLSVKDRTTVLFSTHILSDVERICTHVAFLHNGVVAAEESLCAHKQRRPGAAYRLEVESEADLQLLHQAFPQATQLGPDCLVFEADTPPASQILRFVADQQIPLLKWERLEPSLESLFLEVTNA